MQDSVLVSWGYESFDRVDRWHCLSRERETWIVLQMGGLIVTVRLDMESKMLPPPPFSPWSWQICKVRKVEMTFTRLTWVKMHSGSRTWWQIYAYAIRMFTISETILWNSLQILRIHTCSIHEICKLYHLNFYKKWNSPQSLINGFLFHNTSFI